MRIPKIDIMVNPKRGDFEKIVKNARKIHKKEGKARFFFLTIRHNSSKIYVGVRKGSGE